jgi:hypothetical protein
MIATSLVLHHQNVKILIIIIVEKINYFLIIFKKREGGMDVWTYTIIGPMVNVFFTCNAICSWAVASFGFLAKLFGEGET